MKPSLVLTCLAVAWPLSLGMAAPWEAARPNTISFPATDARFLRLLILDSPQGQPCLDELEIYGPEGTNNLALASTGAKATASSCLTGYAIHQVAHLNDGLHGNSHSWIAAGNRNEWAQIELPSAMQVASVVFSRDRERRFADRLPAGIEVRVSADGTNWQTVARESAYPLLPEGAVSEAALLRYAFECEDLTWGKVGPADPVSRVLQQTELMLDRFAAKGLEVSSERQELVEMRRREQALRSSPPNGPQRHELFLEARLAKRRLFLREPALAALERILFVKRQPYEPSHNYSDIFDPAGAPGGSVCVLETPRVQGRLEPGQGVVRTLFDAKNGVARDPALSFDARQVYFGYRNTKEDYYHLQVMNLDGTGLRQLTDGPFHDYYPCPLPDGGLAFITTRCKARFLCWRPQAFVLFRMDADGGNFRPLSHANLSEWTPAVMNDGRILWMRSEYLDKGADFGHTLWAIHPDGTHPSLVFGNDTLNCYANGREVPGTDEILCTLVSHGGDLNGPLALLDRTKGPFEPKAIANITPDVQPQYHMTWARQQCFRDPFPLDRDYFLCSHAPMDKFGLYVVDRFGNRELLHLDPAMGSMAPMPVRATPRPPVLSPATEAEVAAETEGVFFVADVYQGLDGTVPRGRAKYIRVCEEVRAGLTQLANGEFQKDHEPFQDWYATPTHKVTGPAGWPSYVAKANLGVAPVEADGSASFRAPAGKVLYFELLDAQYNELQRMRSVVQLQPGEKRGCVGCHENRQSAPPLASRSALIAARRAPSVLEPPPWGAGPFAYEQVVQPVWNTHCVRCHDANDKQRIDLTAKRDGDGVPASFRTLIEQGWVHYFDYTWGREHTKAQPLTFGTVQSRLWKVLDKGHYQVELSLEEAHRVKCWTDLNCPLWPDYVFRPARLGVAASP